VQESKCILEFLFDPWVLVQAIHYPSILYQWLIGAYSEILQFERQVSDFFFLPGSKSCQASINLLGTIRSSKWTISRYLYVLQNLIFIHRSPFRTSDFKSALDGMQEELDTFLYQLGKVRFEKGQNVIKALKRQCWNDSDPGPLIPPKQQSSGPGCAFYDSKLYHRKYWGSGFMGNFFLPAMNTTTCSNNERCPACLKMKEDKIKERQDFEYYFNAAPNYKDLDLTLNKMVRFYDHHLEARFPPRAKTDCFLAHLVDKEMLYLQWKFESIESRQFKHIVHSMFHD
jgi:hypothetical protein